MTKPIVQTPDPVLTKQVEKVTKFDNKLKAILSEMKEALLAAKDPAGVGLAAPQIGYSLRIFATRPTKKATVSFYINPQIVSLSQEETKQPKDETPLEGCLSIENTWGFVERKKNVTITFQDGKGKKHTQTFTGFPAAIIQHEVDHLNGILFTTRVLEQKGKLYEITKDKNGKNILKELPL